MTKNNWAFDLEVFPNFFSGTFLNISDPDDIRQFVICWDLNIDDKDKLKIFLDNEVEMLIGYNNLYYDSPVLMQLLEYNGENVNNHLFEFSDSIINRNTYYANYKKEYPWKQMDLMKLMAFDQLGVSLKQCAINLKWHKIQDLPLPFDHNVIREDVEIILKYNINDVLISYELFKEIQPQIQMRKELSALYNVDLVSASDSKIANIILEKIYSDETGIDSKEFKYLRTKREFLWLKDCIAENIRFKTRKLQDLKFEIGNSLVVSENNFAYKKKLQFSNCEYILGVGGLHSNDKPGKFITDENYIIMDCDVSSYYPYIILNNKIKPDHLNENFLDVLRKITEERIEAKRENDKVKADGLKITINSVFGKLGSETFWLQDAKALLSVTVSGQLYLLMLVEDLTLAGIMVISANTDGIVCKIPRNLSDKYYEICNLWSEKTNFDLEFTEYELYVRSDVNNYITKKHDGKTKEKGRYLKEINLKKGYRYPIVPNCFYEYFVNNRPVDETLLNCNDPLDFCISQKVGGKFSVEFRKNGKVTSLQKTNRFYISNSGGDIVKVNKSTGTEIGIFVDEKCKILNDYDNTIPITEYDINYDFYRNEAYKYISEIEESEFSDELIQEELSDKVDDGLTLDIDNIDTSKIKISPPRFGYSKGTYYYNKNDNVIYRGIASIKYVTTSVARELLKLSKNKYNTFVDLLIAIEEETSVNSRQLETLIRLNFFTDFGNNKKLLDIFNEFKNGKNKYSKKYVSKTKEKRRLALLEIEKELPDKRINILEQISYELNLLNYIQTTYNLDKRLAFIEKIVTHKIYAPKIFLHGLKSGNSGMIKMERGIYSNMPVFKGDIILCEHGLYKDSMKKINNIWVKNEGKPKIYWLYNYRILEKEEIENLI